MMGMALGGVKTAAVIQTLSLTYYLALKTIIRKLENGMQDSMWEACKMTCKLTCATTCEITC